MRVPKSLKKIPLSLFSFMNKQFENTAIRQRAQQSIRKCDFQLISHESLNCCDKKKKLRLMAVPATWD